jgi:two-component system, NarL family, sensor kinase
MQNNNQSTNQQNIQQQLQNLQLQQQQLQLQLSENNRRMQLILRRVWQLNDKSQKRIANDLHDGVGQVLTALVNELSMLEQSQPEHKRALELAQLALNDTRQISRLLRPPVLDDLGLQAALNWLVRQISQSCPELQISLRVASDLTLNEELQIMIFRICQEALTNVMKYAQASKCSINISEDSAGLSLSISDNGIGFELNDQAKTGVGLSSMQDRAMSFGGWALIEATPEQGCTITITIPPQTMFKEGQ